MFCELGKWGNTDVYWFSRIMPEEGRSAGKSDVSLTYFDGDDNGYPIGEGFIDPSTNTAISFFIEVNEV